MNILDFLALIPLGLCAVSIRPNKSKSDVFSRDTTAALKGIAALMVIIHHLWNQTKFGLTLLSFIGSLAVGVFFFISGYGNILSINKNQKTDFKWLWNKFIKLFIPYIIIFAFELLSYLIFYPDKISGALTIIQKILTLQLLSSEIWFMRIILLCFAVQWIAKLLFKDIKLQILTEFICLSAYLIIMRYVFEAPSFWYFTVLCYPLGALICYFRQRIANIFYDKTKYFVLGIIGLAAAFLATYILFLFTTNKKISISAYLVTLCVALFSLLVWLFFVKFSIKSKLLIWIGNNSFDFYIIQYVFFSLFGEGSKEVMNQYLYCFLVLVGCILWVLVYSSVKKYLISIKKKKVQTDK